MQKHMSTSGIIIIVLGLLCSLVSITATSYAPDQIIPNVVAINGSTTTAATTPLSAVGKITLGSPQLSYTEYDKTTSFKPAIINGTHGIQISFTGQAIQNGINSIDNGKAFITNGTGGAVYWTGHGEYLSGIGGKAGTVAFTFQAIGHYGADGKLRDIGTVFNTKAGGNLAFTSNMVGIYKDEIDKAGNAITKIWLWK